MESNDRDEITEIYKNLLNTNHEILSGIVHSYSEIAQRFPLELSKLLYDLKNQTDDVKYTQEVLETYFSIMNDVQELLESMTVAIESSNQIQLSLNKS